MTLKYALGLALCMGSIAGCATAKKAEAPGKSASQKQVDYRPYFSEVEYSLIRSAEGGRSCKAPKGGGSIKMADWLRVMNSCLSSKNWKGLEEVATKLNQMDPKSPWAPYYLSLVSETNGNLPKANWFIDQATKRSTRNIGLFRYQQARLHFAAKSFARADAEMRAAVELEPNLIEGYVLLGELAIVDRDSKMARQYFERVLKANPSNPRAIAGLGTCDGLDGKSVERNVANEQGVKR